MSNEQWPVQKHLDILLKHANTIGAVQKLVILPDLVFDRLIKELSNRIVYLETSKHLRMDILYPGPTENIVVRCESTHLLLVDDTKASV